MTPGHLVHIIVGHFPELSATLAQASISEIPAHKCRLLSTLENLINSLCLFCIFTSGFIEAFEKAEIENSVPQEIASSQTWWVLFIWLIVNFVTWLTGVLGTCSIESGSP